MFNTNGYGITCIQIMYVQTISYDGYGITCMQIMYMQLLLMLLKLLLKTVIY